MSNFEHGSNDLGGIHRKANELKYFCYFTGFLEGIASSGAIEEGEFKPLLNQCAEFVLNTEDPDAADFIEDFEASILEHASILDAVEIRAEEIDINCEKSALNRFMGFCAGIACDDLIKIGEAQGVVDFAHHSPAILKDVNARSIVHCCKDAIEDGLIDAQESAEICAAITGLVGDCYADTGISSLGGVPVLPEGEVPENLHDLDGAMMVLTGNFDTQPRRLLEDELTVLGAKITKSVSGKTRYLIVGSEASRDWVSTHKGTKIKKALDLRESGDRPIFLAEGRLMNALQKLKA